MTLLKHTLKSTLCAVAALLAAAMSVSASGKGQPDSLKLLDDMSVLPGLYKGYTMATSRLDMRDYMAAGIDRPIKNMLGLDMVMTELTRNNMRMSSIDSLFLVQVGMVPDGHDTLYVGVVNTSVSPEIDKRLMMGNVKVYNRLGRLTDGFTGPEFTDWLTDQKKISPDSLAEIAREVPYVIYSASFSPDSRTLTLTNLMRLYYRPQDRPKSLDALKPSLVYRLKGKKFKPVSR